MFINKKQNDLKKQLNDQAAEVCAAANICLNSDQFKEYRSRYLKMRELLIEDMLECDEKDPIKYALEMSSLVIKIKTLGLLLGSVQDDAKASKKGDVV